MVSVIQISLKFLKCLSGTVHISCLIYCKLTPHSDGISIHLCFCVSEMHSFALFSNGPLYGYSKFCLLLSIYNCTVSCTSLHSVSFHFFWINMQQQNSFIRTYLFMLIYSVTVQISKSSNLKEKRLILAHDFKGVNQ